LAGELINERKDLQSEAKVTSHITWNTGGVAVAEVVRARKVSGTGHRRTGNTIGAVVRGEPLVESANFLWTGNALAWVGGIIRKISGTRSIGRVACNTTSTVIGSRFGTDTTNGRGTGIARETSVRHVC